RRGSNVGICGHPRNRRGRRSQAAEDAARTVSAAADQHPPGAEPQSADLSPHRGIRPLRPRAGEGRWLLLGADRSRRRTQAELPIKFAAALRGVSDNEAVDRNDPPPLVLHARPPTSPAKPNGRLSGTDMKALLFGCALVLGLAATAMPADAKGCIKGALI